MNGVASTYDGIFPSFPLTLLFWFLPDVYHDGYYLDVFVLYLSPSPLFIFHVFGDLSTRTF